MWSQGGGGSTIIGTFGYMAPEQFSGHAFHQSDLYSLGATLIRILSKKHPIEIPMEMNGLNFEPFVKCPSFYIHWLKYLLFPEKEKQFDSAAEALELLKNAKTNGKLSHQWLIKTRETSLVNRSTRELKTRLPIKIRPEDIEDLFKGSTFNKKITSNHLTLGFTKDPRLSKSLGSLHHFVQTHPLTPKKSNASPFEWANYFLTEKISDMIPGALLGLAGVLAFLISNLSLQLLATGSAYILSIVLGTFLLLKTYGSTHEQIKKQTLGKELKSLQTKGELIPISMRDRVTKNEISLDEKGLSFCTHKSFFLEWENILSFELAPVMQDYKHWQNFMETRFYRLTLWHCEQKAKKQAVAIVPLSKEDASALKNALQILIKHHRKQKD